MAPDHGYGIWARCGRRRARNACSCPISRRSARLPDVKLPQALRLQESQHTLMWNGPIDCRLFRFDLVVGSARTVKPAASGALPPG